MYLETNTDKFKYRPVNSLKRKLRMSVGKMWETHNTHVCVIRVASLGSHTFQPRLQKVEFEFEFESFRETRNDSALFLMTSETMTIFSPATYS